MYDRGGNDILVQTVRSKVIYSLTLLIRALRNGECLL